MLQGLLHPGQRSFEIAVMALYNAIAAETAVRAKLEKIIRPN